MDEVHVFCTKRLELVDAQLAQASLALLSRTTEAVLLPTSTAKLMHPWAHSELINSVIGSDHIRFEQLLPVAVP